MGKKKTDIRQEAFKTHEPETGLHYWGGGALRRWQLEGELKQPRKLLQEDVRYYLVSNGKSKDVCPLVREDAGNEDRKVNKYPKRKAGTCFTQ